MVGSHRARRADSNNDDRQRIASRNLSKARDAGSLSPRACLGVWLRWASCSSAAMISQLWKLTTRSHPTLGGYILEVTTERRIVVAWPIHSTDFSGGNPSEVPI
jgi:hypothetical protein